MGAGFFSSFFSKCKKRSRRFWVAVTLCCFLGLAGSASILTSCSKTAEAGMCGCNLCTGNILLGIPGAGESLLSVGKGVTLPKLLLTQTLLNGAFTGAMASLTLAVDVVLANVTLSIDGFFDAFWHYDMRPSLQDSTEQISTLDADQNRVRTSFTDAHQQVVTQTVHQEYEHVDNRKYRNSALSCVASTNLGGMQRANVIRKTLESSWTTEKLPRTANEVGTPAANGSAADQNVRWTSYQTRYCNPANNNGSAGCAVAGTFPDADIDVAGTLFSKDTVDIRTASTKQNVDDLITNIVEPFSQDNIMPNTLNSVRGREAFLRQQSITAKRQAARDALNYVASRRAPGSNMAAFLRPMRLASGLDPSYISDNPSYEEVMNAMITERFRSGKYQQDLVDEPENVARELVTLQALQVMQLNDQLDLMDRFSILIAAEVGNEISKKQVPDANRSNPVQ